MIYLIYFGLFWCFRNKKNFVFDCSKNFFVMWTWYLPCKKKKKITDF